MYILKFCIFVDVMTARISFMFRMVFMGIMSLWMLSCAPQPELDWVPDIRTVSAEVVENTCGLTAVVTEGLSEEYAVGFSEQAIDKAPTIIPADKEGER